MAPAAPISTGTGTIRADAVRFRWPPMHRHRRMPRDAYPESRQVAARTVDQRALQTLHCAFRLSAAFQAHVGDIGQFFCDRRAALGVHGFDAAGTSDNRKSVGHFLALTAIDRRAMAIVPMQHGHGPSLLTTTKTPTLVVCSYASL